MSGGGRVGSSLDASDVSPYDREGGVRINGAAPFHPFLFPHCGLDLLGMAEDVRKAVPVFFRMVPPPAFSRSIYSFVNFFHSLVLKPVIFISFLGSFCARDRCFGGSLEGVGDL